MRRSDMKLKPCPFCGDDHAYLDRNDPNDDYFEVRCNNCSAVTDYYASEEEAIEAWNRRVK